MRGDVMHGGGRAILARISIEEASLGGECGRIEHIEFCKLLAGRPGSGGRVVGLIQFAERSSRRKVSLNF